ncbi:MAG: L-seryl-tRNA(Sec) selenium transferase [Chloroflexota bacterium]
MSTQTLLRNLPSVDQLLSSENGTELTAVYGRSLTVEAVRETISQTRKGILSEQLTAVPDPNQLTAHAEQWLINLIAPSLQPVINATGVIVHTNLGRAPLSQASLEAIQDIGQGYSNLEFDLDSGQRGSRTTHPDIPLKQLLNSEASLVVNNNAAAVLLMLTALCQGKEVIISRGQLVEIGGGFRIPDVMAQSGAKIVEVGTTNRTHLYDYERAISENTGAILVAHHSNYKIIGFTSEPSLEELAELAHARNIPLLYDQGSGALLDTTPYGIPSEVTVPQGLAAGCDVVAFSGDKLLGGPQAGILCGRADLIQKTKRHPLARAVRADKFCLAGLTTTLSHYIKNEALSHIPVWRMLSMPKEEIHKTLTEWQAVLSSNGVDSDIVENVSTVGGGSLPGTSIDTWVLSIRTNHPQKLANQLRAEKLSIISRIQDGRLLLDPRTVLPQHIEKLHQSLVHCSL